MTTSKNLLPAMILAILFNCSPSDRKGSEDTAKESEDLAAAGMKAVGDSLEIPGFAVEVKLSRRAENKLQKDHETIIVDAFFSGIPKDTTRQEYIEEGRIPVGAHKIELAKPGIARFDGVRISRADFASLAEKDFEVLINIYSGRRSTDLNLLNCEILQEPISKVRGVKYTLKGDLID